MAEVGAYEAKTHLPQLLKRVKQGETIVITRHGVPIAELRQPGSKSGQDTGAAIKELKQFRRKHTLGTDSLRELLDEGRE